MMKKCIALGLVFVFLFCGCGTEKEAVQKVNETEISGTFPEDLYAEEYVVEDALGEQLLPTFLQICLILFANIVKM